MPKHLHASTARAPATTASVTNSTALRRSRTLIIFSLSPRSPALFCQHQQSRGFSQCLFFALQLSVLLFVLSLSSETLLINSCSRARALAESTTSPSCCASQALKRLISSRVMPLARQYLPAAEESKPTSWQYPSATIAARKFIPRGKGADRARCTDCAPEVLTAFNQWYRQLSAILYSRCACATVIAFERILPRI